MKYWLVILAFALNSCGGEFVLTAKGHRALYKSKDGQFSCYANNCCWPYKNKVMICTEAGMNNMSFSIKYIPEK